MPSQRDSEPYTPEKYIKRHEYDTVRKSRFFKLFDSRQNGDSLRQICKNPQIDLHPSTGRRWLKERDRLGDKAYRRTRKISKKLGQKYILATATLDDLLRKDNPLNTKPYETVVKELHLPIKPRTLQHNFAVRKGARRYKKPRIQAISQKNHVERVKYGEEHQNKTISSF